MIRHTRDLDIHFYQGLLVWGAFFEVDMYKRGSPHERKKWTNLIFIEISCRGDLGPALGRKSSQGIKIDSQSIPKSSKIRKIKNFRKTAKNFSIHRFLDPENQFSLCWRSKSYKSLRVCEPLRGIWFASSAENPDLFNILRRTLKCLAGVEKSH